MGLQRMIWWYVENIWQYFLEMLPCMGMALAAFFLVRPQRLRRLGERGLTSPVRREGALLLFLMFCAGLAALTVFPDSFWTAAHWRGALAGERPLFPPVDLAIQWKTLQLEPFQEVLRAFRGPWVMFLMLANIGIFVPVGFFPALLWREGRWWKSALAGLCASVAVELVQFFIGRSTDVDDVLLNTAGALCGYWLFCLTRAVFPDFTAKFQCVPQGEDRNG